MHIIHKNFNPEFHSPKLGVYVIQFGTKEIDSKTEPFLFIITTNLDETSKA